MSDSVAACTHENRTISVVVYNRYCGSSNAMGLTHGDEKFLTSPYYKIVAVTHGELCRRGSCRWCDEIRTQISESTVNIKDDGVLVDSSVDDGTLLKKLVKALDEYLGIEDIFRFETRLINGINEPFLICRGCGAECIEHSMEDDQFPHKPECNIEEAYCVRDLARARISFIEGQLFSSRHQYTACDNCMHLSHMFNEDYCKANYDILKFDYKTGRFVQKNLKPCNEVNKGFCLKYEQVPIY